MTVSKLADHEQMTIEEFLAFTAERPDNERWELIEGVAILNASPTYFHQVIATNIVRVLGNACIDQQASWQPLIGMSTKVPASPRSLPQPDVMVMEAAGSNLTVAEDAIVLFEILSKSNNRTDQDWRKRVYTSIAKCQHYVVVDQFKPLVTRYDRTTGWHGITYSHFSDELQLPALGSVVLPLADIYARTGVAANDQS